MSALQKRILGTVLSAAFSAGLAFVRPDFQAAAAALFGMALAALHIPRPGDTKIEEVK
jgi:hypothetical protein